jgi:hypothetical protein
VVPPRMPAPSRSPPAGGPEIHAAQDFDHPQTHRSSPQVPRMRRQGVDLPGIWIRGPLARTQISGG